MKRRKAKRRAGHFFFKAWSSSGRSSFVFAAPVCVCVCVCVCVGVSFEFL